MTWVRLVLMLYFFMVAHKTACQILSKALEVFEDMVEVLMVLEIFLTEDFYVKDLVRGAPSCSEACLFFSNDLLHLWLQSVQHGLQHDFAWVTDCAKLFTCSCTAAGCLSWEV